MSQTINVDITPNNFQPTLYYSQGDVGRTFSIKIVSQFGDTLPSGATVKIQATKPSGFGFDVTADSVTDNVATFTTTAEMTDEWGRFPAQLDVTKDAVTIFSAKFLMVGAKNTHPEGTTDGSQGTIIPELTLLVERVEAAASSVLDMEVEAQTLPAGSLATYSYDETLNKATFGIPQGEAGAGAAGVTASAYSASKTYAVGEYVIHNNNLYRCTTAITTAEAFTAAHWTQVVLGDDVTDLKSELGEKTYNLVCGELDGYYITNNGYVEADAQWKLFYFPVVSGQKYTIQTNDAALVGGYFTAIPTSDGRTYDTSRVVQNTYVITAPTNGYFAFRAYSTFTKGQAVEGEEEKDYLPPVTAKDIIAREQDKALSADILKINDKLSTREYDLYEGLSAGDTFSLYGGDDCYTVCQIKKGVKIKSVDVLGKNGLNSRLAIVYYDANNTLQLEKYFSLPDATGSYQTIDIDYVTQNDGYVALCNTFGFAVNTSVTEIPIIFRTDGTSITNPHAGTAGLDYTCNIHCESVPILGIDVEQIASDIAMFENIGFCGDSYMAGMIVVSENPTVTAQNSNLAWGKILERTHGINAYLYAKGGIKASDYITDSLCLPKLLSESAKQLYVISLGHNDAYNETSVASFKTAYETIMDSIIAHAPNAKIILCRQSKGYGDMNNGAELNEAISEIGAYYNVPVLDPEDDPYLSSDVYVQTQVHNHPVFAGYAGMAKAFDRLFSKATVDYWDYFKQYTGL